MEVKLVIFLVQESQSQSSSQDFLLFDTQYWPCISTFSSYLSSNLRPETTHKLNWQNQNTVRQIQNSDRGKCSRDGTIGGRVWPVIKRSLVWIPDEATISGWTTIPTGYMHVRFSLSSHVIHRNKRCWHRYVPRETREIQCAVKTNIHLINNVQSIY